MLVMMWKIVGALKASVLYIYRLGEGNDIVHVAKRKEKNNDN